jgi:hypothetical protein
MPTARIEERRAPLRWRHHVANGVATYFLRTTGLIWGAFGSTLSCHRLLCNDLPAEHVRPVTSAADPGGRTSTGADAPVSRMPQGRVRNASVKSAAAGQAVLLPPVRSPGFSRSSFRLKAVLLTPGLIAGLH